MKSLKTQFIGAIAMVLVAAIAMGSSTYAWFAMNTRVIANGMNVKAVASGSLVINADAVVPVGSTSTTISVTNDTLQNLTPVTYDSAWKIVQTPASVNLTTGSPDAALTAVTMVSGTHYMDYLVYIASSGTALTGQTVTATVTKDDTTQIANSAITVAFYVGNASPEANAAPDATVLVGSGATQIKTGVDFPSNASAAAGTPVTMRVYFDGKATSTSDTTTAYINSAHVPTAGAAVTVQFDTTTPSA